MYSLHTNYQQFIDELKKNPFSGDINTDLANRIVFATDNSIYQNLPQAVIAPRHHQDILRITQLLAQPKFRHIALSARGGGTGTNGQSLSASIILDTSKYLTQILEINPKERWVRVQSGVIRDQLNDALKQYGLFFAPSLSTSNRATLGGMTNTDACGQGSCIYGHTSDHILESTCIFADGSQHTIQSRPSTQDLKKNSPRLQALSNQLSNKLTAHQQDISQCFPKLSRYMTGYNLAQCQSNNNNHHALNLNKLIAGSEGTLAIITELKLNLMPIPKFKQVFALFYTDFQDALKSAHQLLAINPTSIETIDDNVLNLAKKDPIYTELEDFFQGKLPKNLSALNLIEFTADTLEELQDKTKPLAAQLSNKTGQIIPTGYTGTQDPKQIEILWNLRKKSVGLLGNTPGERRPLPFIEDTVVPPEHLADYIFELRQLLEQYGLKYGMFGHVDVGCLHVRPALDLKQEHDVTLITTLTEETAKLVKKYHGLLWGEHGKGYRGHYIKDYIGDNLYNLMAEIKSLFDPFNQLNPGKLVSSPYKPQALLPIRSTLRGDYDKQINLTHQNNYQTILRCNGNGACFTYQKNQVICPSYKVTNNRLHSPKGRASLLREWSRQHSTGELTPTFEKEVYHALQGCLGCKGCATACPVQVNIPNSKAKFLNHYYQKNKRPLKDYLIAHIESLLPLQATIPRFFNTLSHNPISTYLIKQLGLADLPRLSTPSLSARLKKAQIPIYNLNDLHQLSRADREKAVILVQDPFTSFYEAELITDAYDLIKKLGYQPLILPFKKNGKAMHVKGFLTSFNQLVEENSQFFNQISNTGIPMIGLDASTVLCYRDEYQDYSNQSNLQPKFNILLISEWLKSINIHSSITKKYHSAIEYTLLQHCTEKSLLPESTKQWSNIFKYFNLTLNIIPSGCCGMAGTYGHETEHAKNSEKLFRQNWQETIEQYSKEQILATGFSCRCQTKRFKGFKPKHPLNALLHALQEKT
ncbi:Anaerobic glycerol-3-phosphate dehydrogenase subunit C [Piscirickettsia salmonis]|uniref:FAD-binding and (Fe-S)-binding domain-containing protein n=1 Tax=Piscirickettsia salmonis TaxID=1238 RepID=UPI0012B83818|nr:FAD-binding and (Fe-S)-binding domain-containing protein [Piscirickettsia salmonis]QGP51170.1 Anaerobic glycerol-3-phosphate dehydrogenase subunit C [Piscirickettsia salmonis]